MTDKKFRAEKEKLQQKLEGAPAGMPNISAEQMQQGMDNMKKMLGIADIEQRIGNNATMLNEIAIKLSTVIELCLKAETFTREALDSTFDSMKMDFYAQLEKGLDAKNGVELVDDPAIEGDTVLLNYKVENEGKVVEEQAITVTLNKTENLTPQTLQTIDALLGMKAGDETKINMDIPAEAKGNPYAGKSIVMHVKVLKVKRITAPEKDNG